MSFDKIVFVPSADSLEQPGARRLLQLAGAESEIEVFEPVYDAHVEVGLATDPSVCERIRDDVVGRRLDKAEALAAALRARGLKASASAAWDHPLYEAVIRRAVKIGADLVITEPLAGRAGALSNGDWRLVAACPLPVLLVNTDGAQAYAHIVAAVDPFHAHDKPAELDAAILGTAVDLGAASGARVDVVHCFLPLTTLLSGSAEEHLPLDDAEAALERHRGQRLDEVAEAAGVDAGSARLIRGRPERVLPDLAAAGADLIVMGALSRGRLRDLVVGSTAEHILATIDADVMIVKPPGFETAVGTAAHDTLPAAPIYYPI